MFYFIILFLFIIIFGLNSDFIENIWFSSSLDNIDNQWIITINNSKYILLSLFLLISSIIFICKNDRFKKYYFLYISIIMLLGNYGSSKIYSNIDQVTQSVNRIEGLPYNFYSTQCGLFAREYFGYYPGSYIVVGTDKLKVESINFWLNSLPLQTIILNSNQKISDLNNNFLKQAKYLVVNGDLVADGYMEVFSIEQCRILKRSNK